MSELLALADRCERSVGPDRELDALVWYYVHPDKETLWSHSGMNAQRKQFREKDLLEAFLRCPSEYGFRTKDHSYTGSIDAAMTLVPDGDPWTLGQNIHHRHWTASINEFGPDQNIRSRGMTSAKTAPLALCAAALRARAAEVRAPSAATASANMTR